MKTENKPSKVIQYLDLIWANEKTESHMQLNDVMQQALSSAIKSGMEFTEHCFHYIFCHYRSGYWLNVSRNGNHKGDMFYTLACQWNPSACQSFEFATQRQPFILGKKRMHERFEFRYDGFYCIVTGWSKDNQALNVVAYDKGPSKGKMKILQFDRYKWLKERSKMKAI